MKHDRRKLTLLYVGLCAMLLLMMIAGLTLAYCMERAHAQRLKYTTTLNSYQKAVSELRVVASAAEPPNPGVEKEEWDAELGSIEYASKLFLLWLRQMQQRAECGNSRQLLGLIATEMQELVGSVRRADDALRVNDQPAVQTYLSYADRHNSQIETLLGGLSEEISRVKDVAVAQDSALGHYYRVAVVLLSAVGLLMLVPTSAYARLLDKRTKEDDAQLQRDRETLERRVQYRTSELKAEMERRRESDARLTRLIDSNIIGIMVCRSDGMIVEANDAFLTMTGCEKEDLAQGLREADMTPGEYRALDEKAHAQVGSTGFFRPYEKEYLCKDGSRVSVMVGGVSIDEGQYFALVLDLTERKKAEQRAQYLAYHDVLTGLPNRVLFHDRLTKAMAGAHRRNERIAVLYLDVDRFKTINDSLGHTAGDVLLKEVTARLMTLVREQDTVARLGGDEFVLLITGVRDETSAAIVADRILKTVNQEIAIHDHLLSVTCSLGISLFPAHGRDCETLLKNADIAMYSAKEAGRNNYRFFEESMNVRAQQNLSIHSGLQHAIERQEFSLVYQPQVDARGVLSGVEALLRWQHPEWGTVLPSAFLPIAQTSGMIVPIGEWVLRTACARARQWQQQGLPALDIAVNVSAVQLRQKDFVELVKRVLQETGLAPQLLELEITEETLIGNEDALCSKLWQLREMGVRLSLDDFGTGYSSLSYLQRFPVNRLKIDQSFTSKVAVSSHDSSITAAIVELARNLEMGVLAEGVETEEQFHILKSQGCDDFQGYFFSRPLSEDAFSAMLSELAL